MRGKSQQEKGKHEIWEFWEKSLIDPKLCLHRLILSSLLVPYFINTKRYSKIARKICFCIKQAQCQFNRQFCLLKIGSLLSGVTALQTRREMAKYMLSLKSTLSSAYCLVTGTHAHTCMRLPTRRRRSSSKSALRLDSRCHEGDAATLTHTHRHGVGAHSPKNAVRSQETQPSPPELRV